MTARGARAAPTRGIRYFGAQSGGYGLAAVAYVRGLLNAGVPVQFTPLEWQLDGSRPGRWRGAQEESHNLRALSANDVGLADLETLIARTSAPIAYDTVIVHAPPETWPFAFEPGPRNVGMFAWETDRMPAHWMPSIARADAAIVPCRQNRDALLASGCTRPVAVVPHVRRHAWNDFSPREIAQARDDLGIPADHRVFYTIGTWDPRKAMPDLIALFARAFATDDKVSLVIKTDERGSGPPPRYVDSPTRELAEAAMEAAYAATGRAPHIALVDAAIDGARLDLLHAVGDVYVSASHGEGFGLGAFEAATLGKPVIVTRFGGAPDFLGDDAPGLVPYALEPVPLWPPWRPSYFPSQRWGRHDGDAAVALLRAHATQYDAFVARALPIRERIVREFAEPIVTRQLLDAIAVAPHG